LELQEELQQQEVIQLVTTLLKVEQGEVETLMEVEEDLVLLLKTLLLTNILLSREAVEEGEEELKTLGPQTLVLMQEIFPLSQILPP